MPAAHVCCYKVRHFADDLTFMYFVVAICQVLVLHHMGIFYCTSVNH
jgi:ATP-dependent Clp protease adapter protein ClpS